MGQRIEDKPIADAIEAELRQPLSALPTPPRIVSLEAVITPEAPAIEAACERVGIPLERTRASSGTIHELIAQANADPTVSGILVNGLRAINDPDHLRDRIEPAKEIAGAAPMNIGRALAGKTGLMPVEPLWPVIAVEKSQIPLWGARATVLGHGDPVSRALAMILIDKRATTTMMDVRNGASIDLSEADLVFAVADKRKIVTADSLKEGCTLIELCAGDIDKSACEKAARFLPAPDPVSAIAIALMLKNSIESVS